MFRFRSCANFSRKISSEKPRLSGGGAAVETSVSLRKQSGRFEIVFTCATHDHIECGL